MNFKGLFSLLALVVMVMVFSGWSDARSIDELIQQAAGQSDVRMGGPQADGSVVVELDIIYTAEQWAALQPTTEPSLSRRRKRKARRDTATRWTNNVVPYRMTNVFSPSDLQQIEAAFAEWEAHTCLQFRPATTSDQNYILIQGGQGCSSYVGMIGGEQGVFLAPGCRYKSVIVHELGHAIGFHHEQTRTDRDQFVDILFANIQPGVEHNFERHSASHLDDHGVTYDYYSIMHYGAKYFSVNGEDTIRTKDIAYQEAIGKADALSPKDIELARRMYNCNECGSDSTLGPHSDACLTNLWLEAGCMTTGSGSPTSNDGNKAWWNARSVAAVRSDMLEYATRAAAGSQNYIERCYGSCGAANHTGPHSLECLAKFWREAGCFTSGSAAPTQPGKSVDWWNERTVGDVTADMAKYYEYAVGGDEAYQEKCFGCGSGTKQGPHSLECLRVFWREAGCYDTGAAYPGSNDAQLLYWNARTVEAVRSDMRQYQRLAAAGSESYQQSCFGCGADDHQGPHSRSCLAQFWTDVGCSKYGTRSPSDVSVDVDWWNARTVSAVKADMTLYYQRGLTGTEDYEKKCFGNVCRVLKIEWNIDVNFPSQCA